MLHYETISPDTLNLFKRLASLDELSEARLAGIEDIAAMKLAAITNRGTKKDFIDLFFLLKTYSLSQMLDMYLKKYSDSQLFTVLKSLVYFVDAESDPMPHMLQDVSWEEVKEKIIVSVNDFIK